MGKVNKPSLMVPFDFTDQIEIKRLIKIHGMEGLGVVDYLNLKLANAEKNRLPLRDLDLLSDEMRISLEKTQIIISTSNMFEIEKEEDGEYFISPKVIEWLLPLHRKVEENRLKGIKSGLSRKNKIEKQIQQLSLLDSSEPQFNRSSTVVEQINKEKKKEIKKEPQDKLEFENFKRFLRKKYEDRNIPVRGKVGDYLPIVRFTIIGSLLNKVYQGATTQLTHAAAEEVYKELYENHYYLATTEVV